MRLPDGVSLGNAFITVTRPMESPLDGSFERREFISNPVQIIANPRYALVANGGADSVSVIDTSNTSTTFPPAKLQPVEIARIPLANLTGGQLAPRTVVITPDGSRAYVLLHDGHGVAVIDAVGLHQVDTDIDTTGIQSIKLPDKSTPFKGAIDPAGRLLYITDEIAASIYVVDVDPFSPTYNQHIRTLSVAGNLGKDAPLGLRGIAVSLDGKTVYVAAPVRTIFGQFKGDQGYVMAFDALQRKAGESVPLLQKALNITQIAVGPEPYDLTLTDDPNVILVTDRLSQTQGLTMIRRQEVATGVFTYDLFSVDLREFGILRRFVEGIQTQVFGVSNIQGVAFIPANNFQDLIGEHAAYALITGYNKFVPGDPRHDPALGPAFAYNFNREMEQGKLVAEAIAAGGNVGFVRIPVEAFNPSMNLEFNQQYQPRIVAATTPVVNGFPDNVAVSLTNGLILAAFQSPNLVLGYDGLSAIKYIETEAKKFYPNHDQIPRTGIDPGLVNTGLLNGPMSTIPIDRLIPSMAVAADIRFYSKNQKLLISPAGSIIDIEKLTSEQRQRISQAQGNNTIVTLVVTTYGIPVTGGDGQTPNRYAPLGVGRLPRGIAMQPKIAGIVLPLQVNPYNQAPTLNSFPQGPAMVDTGMTGTAEVHTGALHEEHALVVYRSMEQDRGLVLSYDSLRAEPVHLFYFSLAGLKTLLAKQENALNGTSLDDARLVVRYVARLAETIVTSAGLSAESALKLGLREGANFFRLPDLLDDTTLFGAALPLDFKDGPSGVYTVEVEYGLFTPHGDQYTGRWQTATFPLAVVNDSKGPFGAGWGMKGYFRLYQGDGSVLLVDGDGNEQIFLAPQSADQPWTSLTLDHSELKLVNGRFERRMLDGTKYRFDDKGRLETITDLNSQVTTYAYSGDNLISITDPVTLKTTFRIHRRSRHQDHRSRRPPDNLRLHGRHPHFHHRSRRLQTHVCLQEGGSSELAHGAGAQARQ